MVDSSRSGYDDAYPADGLRSISFLVSALRRRWKLLVLGACTGVLLAIALFIVVPPSHTATTTLVVVPSANVEAARAMENEAALLQTRTVAGRAIRHAGLSMSTRQLLSSYRVEVVSSRILRLTAEGATRGDAVRRAQGIADAFLGFRAEELQRQALAISDTLRERSTAVTAELDRINAQIIALSSGTEPRTDATVREYGDLLTQRSVLSDRLRQLREQAEAAELEPQAMVRQSKVLDPASENEWEPTKTLAMNAAAGIVGGIAVASGWVVLVALTSDRVRRRQDVVAALQAPFAIGLGPLDGSLRTHKRRFRRHPERTYGELTAVVRKLRQSLSPLPGRSAALAIVSQDADLPAAIAIASTAAHFVREGKNVLLADLSREAVLVRLLGTKPGRALTALPGEGRAWLVRPGVNEDLSDDMTDDPNEHSDFILVLATVDTADGAPQVAGWATKAVVFVAAGRSTWTALRGTARTLTEGGVRIVGGVLMGAERDDRTATMSDMLFADRGDDFLQATTTP